MKFKDRSLEKLFKKDDASGVNPAHVKKIKRILSMLEISNLPEDMDVAGFYLHPLKGNRKGYWAVTVSANWRIIFRFEDGGAKDVELIDYH